jgi:hypothetical protein
MTGKAYDATAQATAPAGIGDGRRGGGPRSVWLRYSRGVRSDCEDGTGFGVLAGFSLPVCGVGRTVGVGFG